MTRTGTTTTTPRAHKRHRETADPPGTTAKAKRPTSAGTTSDSEELNTPSTTRAKSTRPAGDTQPEGTKRGSNDSAEDAEPHAVSSESTASSGRTDSGYEDARREPRNAKTVKPERGAGRRHPGSTWLKTASSKSRKRPSGRGLTADRTRAPARRGDRATKRAPRRAQPLAERLGREPAASRRRPAANTATTTEERKRGHYDNRVTTHDARINRRSREGRPGRETGARKSSRGQRPSRRNHLR